MGGAQLLHASRRVRDVIDADGGSHLLDDDRLAGIFDDDASRDPLLGHELKCAVRKVLVGNGVVIQECDIRVRGLGMLRGREGQCCKCQHPETARVAPGANACNGRIQLERPGFRQPARYETEAPSGHVEQGCRWHAFDVEDKLAQHNVSAAGDVEESTVDEADCDLPVGVGLQHVAPVDGRTSYGLCGDAARSRKRTATDHSLNMADEFDGQGHGGPAVNLDAGCN
ncbi:hypothetical protein [Bradyrhizobium ottawaense]|uniref:hypothetical protein n=1 Tax=Bradyrhizobium ottawaense TaxID=931866 RepID=UPI003512D28A